MWFCPGRGEKLVLFPFCPGSHYFLQLLIVDRELSRLEGQWVSLELTVQRVWGKADASRLPQKAHVRVYVHVRGVEELWVVASREEKEMS